MVASADVFAIVSTDVPTTADLSAFIDVAQLVADENLTGKITSTALLDMIVTYLAAHFAVLKYKYKTNVNVGVGIGYQSAVQAGALSNTHYGQQAMLLDTSGTLAALDGDSRDGKSRNAFWGAY